MPKLRHTGELIHFMVMGVTRLSRSETQPSKIKGTSVGAAVAKLNSKVMESKLP